MSNELSSKTDPEESTLYQIRIEGPTISLEVNGDTLLTGPVVDQASLHGLLKKCGIWERHWSRSFVLKRVRQMCQRSNINLRQAAYSVLGAKVI